MVHNPDGVLVLLSWTTDEIFFVYKHDYFSLLFLCVRTLATTVFLGKMYSAYDTMRYAVAREECNGFFMYHELYGGYCCGNVGGGCECGSDDCEVWENSNVTRCTPCPCFDQDIETNQVTIAPPMMRSPSWKVYYYRALDYCVVDTPPLHGSMGTCTEYLYADESCEFSCEDNYTLSRFTTCVRGEPHEIDAGQCLPSNANVETRSVNSCIAANHSSFALEFNTSDLTGIPCCGGECDDFEICVEMMHAVILNLPVWNPNHTNLQGETYVVFEREAREFQSFHTFMFQLRHKNMMRVAHSYRKKVTRKSTLEYKLDYDEHLTRASRSNTGTWNMQ